MKELQLTADKLQWEQRYKTSKKTYYYGWRSFSNFILRLDERPDTWDEKLILFMAHLIGKHPEQTIRSYVSAVRGILKEDGVQIGNISDTL